MALSHGQPAPCDEAAAARRPCDDAGPDRRTKRWALALAVLGSSLAFIEGSVVNVVLPQLQADLGLSAAGAQWVVNAYLLFLSGLMLLGGSLGDRYGVRRVFAAGVALFGLGALACGLAPTAPLLIAARAFQGAGGALLVPASLALLGRLFPKDERGAAIGTWAGFSALTTALGPVLGGWLADVWDWRGVFLVMPVPAAVAAWLALTRIPPQEVDRDRRTDWTGAALAVAALAGLSLGFILVPERGWGDPAVWGSLAVGAAAAVVFVLFERRRSDSGRDPLLPLGLFRSRPFSGANAATVLLYMALNACLFLLPFQLIQGRGYSPTAAGAAFLPFSLVMGIGSRYAGRWFSGAGAGRWLALGSALAGGGMALLGGLGRRLGLEGGGFWSDVLPGMLLLGIGMTIAVPPLTTIVLNSAGEARAGAASGVNNTAARVAGLLAIALLGSFAVARYEARLEEGLARGSGEPPTSVLAPEVREEILARSDELLAAALPEGVDGRMAERVEAVRREAFAGAFATTSYLAGALALLAAAVSLVTLGRGGSRTQSS
jgi:EmrB/QacA subfamily drug resistance transporter